MAKKEFIEINWIKSRYNTMGQLEAALEVIIHYPDGDEVYNYYMAEGDGMIIVGDFRFPGDWENEV